MAIYCVVFELRREREEYRQFFKHLGAQQRVLVTDNCSLVFSHNSAESLQKYFQNFIGAGDTLFVGEMGSHWALNSSFEATEWLRELQALSERRQSGVAQSGASQAQRAP